MNRKIYIIMRLLILILLVSCAKDSSVLIDGYYSAEVAEFDSHGWKEFLTICVSNGKIILVEYNAYNPAGFVKTWDMDHMREMNAMFGTYASSYTRIYARQFLENQSTEGIDVISGATVSHSVFTALANAVLARAHEGNKNTAFVEIEESL